MSVLSRYIAWNEALLDYFVKNGSTVWFVTDSVIEYIGRQYEIRIDRASHSFANDFVRTVFFVCNKGTVSNNRIYNEWFKPVSPIRLANLEGENDGCTEVNLTQFDELGRSINDVYNAFKFGRLSQLLAEVDIPQAQFNQIVEACVEDFEEVSLNRPLCQLVNDRFIPIQKENLNNISTILDFALFLTGKEFYYNDFPNKKRFDAPYFSYLILLLFGFNNSNNQTWEEVENLFHNYGLSLNTTERKKTAKLFESAIHDGLLNDSCTRTPDKYVKYLKYHSVLTPGRREALESVLYDHNIAITEGLRFNDLRNWIWRVSPRTALNQFRNELLKTENASYFLEIIKSFNREEYRKKRLITQDNQNTRADRQDGQFRFVVDAETQSLSVWVEGIKVNEVLRSDNIKITPNYILPDNYIANVPDLSWGGYAQNGLSYKEDGICIKSALGKSCYYFEIVNNRWLVEVAEPDRLANRQCLFVTNGENENLVSRHNAQEVTEQVLRFFLPTGWHLYVTNSYVLDDISEDDTTKDSLNTQKAFARVALDDAIRVNDRGKLCFIAEMFPYITFDGIEYENIRIKAFDSIDKHTINFKQKNIGERIYLYDIATVQSGEMILEIYDEQGNRIDYNVKEKSHFQIRSVCDILAYNDKEYVKFDKWFCLTNDEETYYSNNRVYPLANNQIFWETTTQPPTHNEHQSYSRMMAVLYALGETRGHNGRKAIPNSVLESVFKYEADFMGISLDKFQMYRLKNALCELGVLTHYYDGGHYYQTNSACLIPTGKKYVRNALDLGDRGTFFYILSGVYSKTDYEMVINNAEYVEYVQQHDPLYSLLPPIVKVGFRDNNENALTIPVNNNCTYSSLLYYAGNISDFDTTMEACAENIIGSQDENAENVPCLIPSIDYRGKREQLRIDQERIMVNPDFPLPLLRNYVNYKQNNPIWFESGGGEIFIKEEKAIPFFAKRALNSFSGNLSKEVYVFGVDNIIGNGEKQLFERLITYMLPTGEARNQVLSMLRNVLGGGTLPISNVTIPNERSLINLSLFAYKTKVSDVDMWWLELTYKDNIVCFSDPNNREIYCLYDGGYHRMIRTDDHDDEVKDTRSFNERFSKVIKLYDDLYNFNVQDFYVTKDEKGHILKERSVELDYKSKCTDLPSKIFKSEFKKEVIIMR